MSTRALASRIGGYHYEEKVSKFTRKRGLRRARRLPVEVAPSDWERDLPPVLVGRENPQWINRSNWCSTYDQRVQAYVG